MENNKWWQSAVVYQVYPMSFQDSNQDGIGDLQGIINRLDYLEALGVNVLWLCPINVSPMKDNGYDIADYYKVDPSFGTNEDFEELIAKAKDHGIKIVMDLVINHCSDQHVWFREACKDPDGKYGSYFIIEETDGEVPNNLRGYGGTSAWERIGDTNRFYFHCFSKEQPDLNWENAQLRREMIEMMKFWGEKGVAGFRVDAIGNIKKSSCLRQRIKFPSDGEDGLASINPYVLLQPGIRDFLLELRDQVFVPYDMMTVAELNVPEEEIPQYIGENGVFSMVFDFSYTDIDVQKIGGFEWKRPWTMEELREKMYASQLSIQKYGWGSPYLENHDQPRSVNKYLPPEGRDYFGKTALATLFFFLKGTPFIYQGQELGMENYPFQKIDDLRDPFAIARYYHYEREGLDTKAVMDYFQQRARDNSRTPMQWNNSEYAGFSEKKPWINVNPNYLRINAEEEEKAEESVLHYYQKMVDLRTKSPYAGILTFGRFEPIEVTESGLFIYNRVYEGKSAKIIVNLSNQEIEQKLTGEDASIILCNMPVEYDRLKPYQALIIIEE